MSESVGMPDGANSGREGAPDELMRALFDSMGEGVVMLDERARVTAANPAAVRMLGVPREALLGRSPLDPDWYAIHVDGTELGGDEHPGIRTLRTGLPTIDATVGSLRPDGTVVWVLASSHPVLAADGRCVAAVTTFVDITHRLEQDRARRRDEEAFRELTELSEDLITWHDVEGRVRYASGAGPRVLGVPSGALLGRSLGRWCHPDDRHLIVAAGLRAVQAGGDALEPITWRAVRDDGEIRHIDTRARVRWDPDTGHQLGFVAYSRDVTDSVERAAALRHSEARFRAVAESAPIGIVGIDRQGRCTFANERAAAICGIRVDELVGRAMLDAVHPHDQEQVAVGWATQLADTDELDGELRIVRPDGTERWCRVKATPIDVVGHEGTAMVGSIEDVTEARSARLFVESVQARFGAAFAGSPIATAVVTHDGTVEDHNPAWFALVGDRTADIEDVRLRDVVHPDDADRVERLLAVVAADPDRRAEEEVQLACSDGGVRWVQVHIALLPPSALHAERLLVQLIDMTTQRQLEAQLRALAELDPLTGALNRRCLDDLLRTPAGRRACDSARTATTVLAMVDLDHFKAVNDSLGHQAGDEILIGVVGAMRAVLRPDDRLARLGGDEFAIVLPGVGLDGAREVATRLLDAVRRFAATRPTDVERAVTASIGLAACAAGGGPLDALAAADRALYRAKAAGRDRWDVEERSPAATTSPAAATIAGTP